MRNGMTMVVLVLAGLSGVGCGGGGGGGGEEAGGGGTAGGESAYAGPVASSDVALGEQKYQSRCASCHESGAPPVANLAWSAERMRQQIREGSGQMPGIPAHRLSDEEMEAVLAYLQTINGVEGGSAAPAEEQPAEAME